MPNHVTNKIKLIGEQKRVDELLNAVKYDEGEVGTIDFNKLIPMPKSLDLASGSIETFSIEAYLTVINPQTKDYGLNKIGDVEFEKLLIGLNNTRYFSEYSGRMSTIDMKKHACLTDEKTVDSLIDLGKKYTDNFKKYGCTTWYEFCNSKWGTKWNSYYEQPFKNNTLTFSTAWSRAMPIVEVLAKSFPDIDIEYSWADEDIGNNVGRAYFSEGELTEEYFPEIHSKEAYEMATEIRDCELSDYGLHYDESCGTYSYNEDITQTME